MCKAAVVPTPFTDRDVKILKLKPKALWAHIRHLTSTLVITGTCVIITGLYCVLLCIESLQEVLALFYHLPLKQDQSNSSTMQCRCGACMKDVRACGSAHMWWHAHLSYYDISIPVTTDLTDMGSGRALKTLRCVQWSEASHSHRVRFLRPATQGRVLTQIDANMMTEALNKIRIIKKNWFSARRTVDVI